MQPVTLLTITREFGAGGSELAAELGRRLGWRVLDREIVSLVARRLGVARTDVEARDEHAPGLLERIGTSLLRTSPDFVAAPETVRLPDPAEIAAASREVLLEAAASPPLVVVGHGGQSLFHGRPDALHVRLVAPLESRVRRICGRSPSGEREAAALAQRMDAERVAYVRRYFGRDWHDPLLYDLQVNTRAIGIAEAAAMVLQLVDGRRSPTESRAPATPDAPGAASAAAGRGA
jgi:cytidylate kinase